MTSTALAGIPASSRSGGKDIGFAVAIVLILCFFFLPSNPHLPTVPECGAGF